MLLIISLVILFGLLLYLNTETENELLEFVSIFLGLFDILTIIILICLIKWPKIVEKNIIEYNELKTEVEQVYKIAPEQKSIIPEELFKSIREMNVKIDKNALYCDSWWLGWFFSDEIGNLEKIEYIIE
jgi:hypothetical protein